MDKLTLETLLIISVYLGGLGGSLAYFIGYHKGRWHHLDRQYKKQIEQHEKERQNETHTH